MEEHDLEEPAAKFLDDRSFQAKSLGQDPVSLQDLKVITLQAFSKAGTTSAICECVQGVVSRFLLSWANSQGISWLLDLTNPYIVSGSYVFMHQFTLVIDV